jgi:sucrose-6-phosphate hydrolase SacC (GH32 family)
MMDTCIIYPEEITLLQNPDLKERYLTDYKTYPIIIDGNLVSLSLDSRNTYVQGYSKTRTLSGVSRVIRDMRIIAKHNICLDEFEKEYDIETANLLSPQETYSHSADKIADFAKQNATLPIEITWKVTPLNQLIDKCDRCFSLYFKQTDREGCSTCINTNRVRKFSLSHRFLYLPIARENITEEDYDDFDRLHVFVDGKIEHIIDIHLAEREYEISWWAELSVPKIGECTLVLRNDSPKGSLILIENSDKKEVSRREALRPQLHFSQSGGWLNDVNGLVFHDGLYHLFWQSNPFGLVWGNCYWGHAISSDLVHWEELRPAIQSRISEKGADGLCFSGGGNVLDSRLVIAYTDTERGQCLAFSDDNGLTFKPYDGNPVLSNMGRDSKLIWYDSANNQTGHWVMIIYSPDLSSCLCDEIDTGLSNRGFAFYISKDLINWEYASCVPGFYECPEMIYFKDHDLDFSLGEKSATLSAPERADKNLWVLFGSNTEYLVGTFDGRQFTPLHENTEKKRMHYGHYKASQCFTNLGNRVVQIGWTTIDMPGMPFNQCLSLPLELSLVNYDGEFRLHSRFVDEIDMLVSETPILEVTNQVLTNEGIRCQLPNTDQLFNVPLSLNCNENCGELIYIEFGESKLTFDLINQTMTIEDEEIPLILGLDKKDWEMRLIIDRPMYELSVGGLIHYTGKRKDGGQPIKTFSVYCRPTAASATSNPTICSLKISPMISMWKGY